VYVNNRDHKTAIVKTAIRKQRCTKSRGRQNSRIITKETAERIKKSSSPITINADYHRRQSWGLGVVTILGWGSWEVPCGFQGGRERVSENTIGYFAQKVR